MNKLCALLLAIANSTSFAAQDKQPIFTQISSDSGVCAYSDQGKLYCSEDGIMAERIHANIRVDHDTVADFSNLEKFVLLSDYQLCGLRNGNLICGGHRNPFNDQSRSRYSKLNLPNLTITDIWGGHDDLFVKYSDGHLGYIEQPTGYDDSVNELATNYMLFDSKVVWTTQWYAADNIGCGLTHASTVACVGRRGKIPNLPAGGKPFPDWSTITDVVDLSAGKYEICLAIRQNIRCYDKVTGKEYTVNLKNTVKLVSAYNGADICLDPANCIPNLQSSRHCALDNEGTVSCWYAERSYLFWIDTGSKLKFEKLSNAIAGSNICGLSGGQPYCYFKKDDWRKVALVPME